LKFFTLTLTNAATAYNLQTLLKAQTGFRDGARQVIIMSPASNTGYVRIGGSDVSATVYGINLPSVNSSVNLNTSSLGETYALSEQAGDKLNVTLVY